MASVVFVASLVVLLKMMLEVTSAGGFCARGGPYVIAHECSAQTAALVPLSIVAMLISAGFGAFAGGIGRIVAFLAWPALFCTLGGGFIYSTRYPAFGPQGYALGGMFVLMGAGPLISAAFFALRRARLHAADGGGLESPSALGRLSRFAPQVVALVVIVAAGWWVADWILRHTA